MSQGVADGLDGGEHTAADCADICLNAGQMLTTQTRIFCTSAALCQVQAGVANATCGWWRSSDEGRCLHAVRTA